MRNRINTATLLLALTSSVCIASPTTAPGQVGRLVQVYSQGLDQEIEKADKELATLNKDDLIAFIREASGADGSGATGAEGGLVSLRIFQALITLDKRDSWPMAEQLELLRSKNSTAPLKRTMIRWFAANKSSHKSISERITILDELFNIAINSPKDPMTASLAAREAYGIAMAFASHYSLLKDKKIGKNVEHEKLLLGALDNFWEKLGTMITHAEVSDEVLDCILKPVSTRMASFRISDTTREKLADISRGAIEKGVRSPEIQARLKGMFLVP